MPAYTEGKTMGSGLGRWLTIVAQINMIRIDFLRLQIAHVLKAKMTGKTHISGGLRGKL